MKPHIKLLAPTAALCIFASCALLGGCAGTDTYVTSIKKTGVNGTEDIYTVTYSDGRRDTFTVTNGSDGANADISAIYEAYKTLTGQDDCTFEEFLAQYLTVSTDTSQVINRCLCSSMSIYAEFVETSIGTDIWGRPASVTDVAVSTGAAVIYRIDEADDGYTYLVTDYHVVYDKNANSSKNGGSKLARAIYGYLYGSEETPTNADEDGDGRADTDENGYAVYDYGETAVALEYVGGTVTYDIAVLRAKTSDLKEINEDICAVTLADDCHAGETAIAIGNPEGDGISVTQGIVSTESEYISLNIDGTVRSYRSTRIDTPLYSGNSGGGLFNRNGELIGITNAGDGSDQNINYAVPLAVVRSTAESILHYAADADETTQGVYTLEAGLTVEGLRAKYVYDPASGYGRICEEVTVVSVAAGSVAESLGLTAGDRLFSLTIDGKDCGIDRAFDWSDLAMTVRGGDILEIVYERDGVKYTTQPYTVTAQDLVAVE